MYSFLSHFQVFLGLPLEISILLFFLPILFSSYCCTVDSCVVCVVSDRWSRFFFALSYAAFKLSCRCIDVTLNAGKSSPSLCSWHMSTFSLGCNILLIVISFLNLWFICWSFSLVHFKNGPQNLTRVREQVFNILMRFLVYSLVLGCLLVLLSYSFLNFFLSSPLVWWNSLPMFLSTHKFLFLGVICIFLYLVVQLFPFSLGRLYARSICSIFPLCIDSNALEKSTNYIVI